MLAAHCFDDESLVANWLLFNVGRHAYHHIRPAAPFDVLAPLTHQGARRLPLSLFTMYWLAPFGPLFRALMERGADGTAKRADDAVASHRPSPASAVDARGVDCVAAERQIEMDMNIA